MKEVRFDRAATPKGPPTPPPKVEFVGPGQAIQFTETEIDFSARELEQIMNPAYLELISGATGFSFSVIDEPPSGVPQHVLGFTDMRRKRIFLVRKNAARLLLELKASGTPEKGAQKLKGFLVHEGGHHAPEVLALDEKLRAILGKPDLEPNELQEYFNDPADRKSDDPEDKGETRALFWKAFWYDNCNGSLDVWLESFQARGQFDYSLGEDLLALHESSVTGRDFLRGIPLHHQLTQVLVGEESYFRGRGKNKVPHRRARELDEFAQANLDPEVAKVLSRLRHDGVMAVMADRSSYEYWGGNTPEQKARSIQKKFQAVVEHIYPAWRKLLLLEFERRKVAFREAAKAAKKGFTDPELKEIYHQILKELLDKTQEMGKGAYASETPGEDDPQKMDEIFKKIQASGGRGKEPNAEAPPPSALDQTKNAINRGLEDVDAKKIVDLADRFGVSEASLRKLQDIERKYAGEIERLAMDIADSFLNQRRARIRYQMLEGMTTPGMEGIEFAEAQRGNLDVRTHQITEQAAEFLQTEVEHLFDTSGSMSANNRLEYAQIVSVILTRAFEKVKAILEGEGLLRPQEEDPLRSGYVLFTTAPERIKKLDEPSKPGTLAQMIEQTGKHSGGTDDAAAIKALETQFKLRESTVLKFMIIYSDGEGNAGAVQNIMEAIEKDKSIIVVIVAMGANPGNVAATYETTVRAKGGTNIKIVQGDDVKANLPELTNFFRKVIRDASERLS